MPTSSTISSPRPSGRAKDSPLLGPPLLHSTPRPYPLPQPTATVHHPPPLVGNGARSKTTTRPSLLPLLLLVLLLHLCMPPPGSHAAAASHRSTQREALNLFTHWSSMACGMPRGKVMTAGMALTDEKLLEAASLAGFQKVELYRYSAASKQFKAAYPRVAVESGARANAYARYLGSVFDAPPYKGLLSRDFAFFFEAGDGFKPTSQTAGLPLPILTNARYPGADRGDVFSLPGVDSYMAMGYLDYKALSAKKGAKPNPQYGDAWRIFTHNYSTPSWDKMQDSVVYRGSYKSEYDRPKQLASDLIAKKKVIKADVCLLGGKEGCKEMDIPSLMKFRYQLDFDESPRLLATNLWKYSSGSVVIRVFPKNETTGELWKPWDQWWTPSLKADVHYLAASLQDVPNQLEVCRKRKDGCQTLGIRSRRDIMATVNFDSAALYTSLVIRHIHDAVEASGMGEGCVRRAEDAKGKKKKKKGSNKSWGSKEGAVPLVPQGKLSMAETRRQLGIIFGLWFLVGVCFIAIMLMVPVTYMMYKK